LSYLVHLARLNWFSLRKKAEDAVKHVEKTIPMEKNNILFFM
jgi:ribosomal protein L31E